MNNRINTPIHRNQAKTLFDLFKARVDRTPTDVAYSVYEEKTQCWVDYRWLNAFQQFIKARNALAAEKLVKGDRILLTLPNGLEWIAIEQAAHYLGLVVVALPANESAARINHIIDDTDAAVVFISTDAYQESIQSHVLTRASSLKRRTKIISLDKRESSLDVTYYSHWLENNRHSYEERYAEKYPERIEISPNALATIIYTAGTTGSPKGVMHSHRSLLNNCFSCFERIKLSRQDKLLSTVPLSHIMERTSGYYVPMIGGASICFSPTSKGNATHNMLHNLKQTQANTLVTTPHTLDYIFGQILNKRTLFHKTISQFMDFRNGVGHYRLKFIFWPLIEKIMRRTIKKQFTKHLKQIFCGGASISNDIVLIAKMLDTPLFQGYGLTETGVISVNSPAKQKLGSVGLPLANANISFTDDDELIIESDSLMLGYWKNPALDKHALSNGKFHTGDIAHFDNSFIHLTGRQSQQIQLSNSRKISPLPIEKQICADQLFKNASLFGENREKLSLVCQLCPDNWAVFLAQNNVSDNLSEQRKHTLLSVRINTLIKSVPDHHFIDFIIPTFEPWDTNNKLVDVYGKVNKDNVEQHYSKELRAVYGKDLFE